MERGGGSISKRQLNLEICPSPWSRLYDNLGKKLRLQRALSTRIHDCPHVREIGESGNRVRMPREESGKRGGEVGSLHFPLSKETEQSSSANMLPKRVEKFRSGC